MTGVELQGIGDRSNVMLSLHPNSRALKDSVLRVLLVEDDDIDAKLVSLCAAPIEAFKLDIERVMSSADARLRLAESHFDLCIVDFWLGCESSIRFLAELDGFRGGTPALVLTSLSTPDIRNMCVMAGAAVFLGKADLSAATLENAVIRSLTAAPDDGIAPAPTGVAPLSHAARAHTPGRFEVRALQSMTETVRFGMFETFWADRFNSDPRPIEGRSINVGDFILGAVESACGLLDDRGQAVSFQRPSAAVAFSCDPASFFFLLFELLSRASRLCARDSMLTVGLRADGHEIRIEFRGGTRIDSTAGALALGPLCAQILADHHAVFADTSKADGGFLLTVCFPIKTAGQAYEIQTH